MTANKQSILVIRLGALGDLVMCFQAFQSIRRAHPDASITLLTRAPFAAFAKAMPWFDAVMIDERPTLLKPWLWVRLRRQIRALNPARVYDLQGKNRQNILYALLGGPFGPLWSGAAPACAFPRPSLKSDWHFRDFLAAQLAVAGVASVTDADTKWLDAPVGHLGLPPSYVVLVPGCSPRAFYKKWPAASYASFANFLHQKNIPCVVVGTETDRPVVDALKQAAPQAIDLCGRTTPFELAGICRHAAGVVGNDTGPVHMASVTGVPTLALLSGRTDPVWSKPPGAHVATVQSEQLVDLSVDQVIAAFDLLLQQTKSKSR